MDLGFGIEGLELRDLWVWGFRVQGLGFRVWRFRVGIEALGFAV